MTERALQDRRILVVEDEYYLAMELERELAGAGAEVLGPVPSIDKALAAIASEPRIDVTVLDMNLGGEMSHPVADTLARRGIPFIITTGYVDGAFDDRFAGIRCCDKPIDMPSLVAALAAALN